MHPENVARLNPALPRCRQAPDRDKLHSDLGRQLDLASPGRAHSSPDEAAQQPDLLLPLAATKRWQWPFYMNAWEEAGKATVSSGIKSTGINFAENTIKLRELVKSPHAYSGIRLVPIVSIPDDDILPGHLRCKGVRAAPDIGVHEIRL